MPDDRVTESLDAYQPRSFRFLGLWREEEWRLKAYGITYGGGVPREEPTNLKYVTPRGLSACVWDLRLIWFERQAWVDAMLGPAAFPDPSAYLEARLDEDS